MNDENLKHIMKNEDKTWFTLRNLSEIAQIPELEIQTIIKKSHLFAQSAASTDLGEKLFSTRDDFQNKVSFANRILGAFKNRID